MEMTLTETKSATRGSRLKCANPPGGYALASPANPQLVELLRSSHGVPFFICAPRKTGRTSLALNYARRQHHLDEVLWMGMPTDGFCEAIRSGSLLEHLEQQRVNGLMRFSLVVFDDFPSLGDREASRFSDWVDHLIEEDIETIVITTPYEDCLSDYQSDRLLIDGGRLVASQKWNGERMGEVLNSFLDAPVPRESVTLAAVMVLAGHGTIDDLRGLGYRIPAAAHTVLRQCCPLIEIDENTGSFDASGFPVERLRRRLLALLNEAAREEGPAASDIERCFGRLTQLSTYLFEHSEPRQSQLLLELAGSLLAKGSTVGLPFSSSASTLVPDGEPAVAEPAPAVVTPEPVVAEPTVAEPAPAVVTPAPAVVELTPAAARITPATPAVADAPAQVAEKPRVTPAGRSEALVVRLFGDFEIFRDGRRVEGEHLKRSRVRSLMTHLALNMGRGVSRDTLMERIWPDKEFSRAKDNFHSTWSRLTKLLSNGAKPSPYLTNNQGICRLESSTVTVDVYEFERLSRSFLFDRGDVEQRIEMIYRLEQLYRGDILSGYQVDLYVQGAQQRYRAILVDVMLEASKLFSQEGNDTSAVWFARKAYDTDPTREDVYRILMAMQNRAGQRTNALRTYFDCKRFLSEELGILPSQKTTALYQDLILDRR